MLATTILSCRLWRPAAATGYQGPFTVSARYSRPRKNINYDYEDEEEEDEKEIDSWKLPEIGDADDASVEEQAKISGSVVLLALQKASAQKTSKKTKKKKKEVDDKRPRQGDASTDYSAVKSLCIKSDWKDRLDELEMQLHQLIRNA
ncbi:hypothetical protein L2E82_41621 [Cichorium intybus]|uniref:Uncharacterized protein n=1 Tax=Cichorium intybus TaxID=13427 RepID=A0ACB9AP13_CICIN|nr:hypothetical protein L2E82_41621 [Cichorium intybus]